MTNQNTPSQYRSPKDKGVLLRQQLKALGYGPRKVSVTTDDLAIRVLIRDEQVDRQAVNQLALAYREVDYCQASGEILSGANCYVTVRYESGGVARTVY